MLRDFMWKIFENTGSIDSYIFYTEMKERDKAEEQRMLAEDEAATATAAAAVAVAGSN